MTTTEPILDIPLQALKDWNSEMFEDGVEADLHDAGIKTLAEAYRQGKEDQIEELIAEYGERDKIKRPTRRRSPVGSSELFDALARTVNRYRYRGPDGKSPITDSYRWPLSHLHQEEINNAALRYVIAIEKASNDRTERPEAK